MYISCRKKYMKVKQIDESIMQGKKPKKRKKLTDYSKSINIEHKESELSVMIVQEIRHEN